MKHGCMTLQLGPALHRLTDYLPQINCFDCLIRGKKAKIFFIFSRGSIVRLKLLQEHTVRMRVRPEVKNWQQLKPFPIIPHNLSTETGNNLRQLKFICSNFLKKKCRLCADGIF